MFNEPMLWNVADRNAMNRDNTIPYVRGVFVLHSICVSECFKMLPSTETDILDFCTLHSESIQTP